jgi:GntR family transcriptional regulator
MTAAKPPPSTKVTKAERLREHLLKLIDREFSPHDKLPTERELAETFGMSRLVVRQVLDRLQMEGRVYREQGSGTFVGEPRINKTVELTSFSDDMRSRGLEPGALRTEIGEIWAGAEVGAKLEVSPSTKIICIKRVRTADGRPMCVESSYIPADLVPGILDRPFEGSLYELLNVAYHFKPKKADQVIRATVLDPVSAKDLEVAPFSPAFDVRRIVFDARSRPIEYAESLYRGDRYSYDLTIYRTNKKNDL